MSCVSKIKKLLEKYIILPLSIIVKLLEYISIY